MKSAVCRVQCSEDSDQSLVCRVQCESAVCKVQCAECKCSAPSAVCRVQFELFSVQFGGSDWLVFSGISAVFSLQCE